MKIHIITLFPEAFDSYFSSSIIGRAKENKKFEVFFYKLSDFSSKKFGHVDDKAYGMHGQVLCAEPLACAIDSIFENLEKKIPIFFLTPSGEILNQQKVESFFESTQECILLCGHYEWIDERIIDIYGVQKVSIGEYVISSGELAAMVFIDALVRHIPWVLWNTQSLEEESFSEKLDRKKEYPVYTRPEVFRGLSVPSILLSWNHGEIEKRKQENIS